MDPELFLRYLLDLAARYPGAVLCFVPALEFLRSPRRTLPLAAAVLTALIAVDAALCAYFHWNNNHFLLAELAIVFFLYRRLFAPKFSRRRAAFAFLTGVWLVEISVLLAMVFNARAELGNTLPVCLPSTALPALAIAAALGTVYCVTAARWIALLLALVLCAGLPAAAHAAETRVVLTLHTTDSSDSTQLVSAGALVTLPLPVREGFIFDGWYSDAACSAGSGPRMQLLVPNGGAELWAKWVAEAGAALAAHFTLTFDTAGGAVNSFGGNVTVGAGAQIVGNEACLGGGIFADGGTVTITGGTVKGNEARYGGVYVLSSALEMSGGEVTGNTAANNGGGVYYAPLDEHPVQLSGSPRIIGNTGNGAENNVFLEYYDTTTPDSTRTLLLTGALGAGAEIGVTRNLKPTDADPVKLVAESAGYTITESDREKFFSDDPAYAVRLQNASLVMTAAVRVDGLSVSPAELTLETGAQSRLTAAVTPDDAITRAEAAAVINRMLARSADAGYIRAHAGELAAFRDLAAEHWAYFEIMEAANDHGCVKTNGIEHWE